MPRKIKRTDHDIECATNCVEVADEFAAMGCTCGFDAERKVQMTKTITVRILCLIVSSDGFPVGEDGEEFSKGYPFYEWEKRRLAITKFCPNDVCYPERRNVLYFNPNSAIPKKCKCHKKWRLGKK